VLAFFSAAVIYKHPVVRSEASRDRLNTYHFVLTACLGGGAVQGRSVAVYEHRVDRRRLVVDGL
jgi:hypothetical protein